MKTLRKDKLELDIDLKGAWIKRFSKDGKDIFFPYKEMEIGGVHKLRGGMHVCAPNFGPDEILGELAQHGYGRDENWDIIEEGEDFISLGLSGQGSYENVDFSLSYRLTENKLVTEFIATNKGEDARPINPAFHPYFYTKDCNIEIEDFNLNKDKLPDSMTDESQNESIKTSNFDIDIIGEQGVGTYIIWSDFGDDYVCVEPSYNGMSFRENNLEPYDLKAGQTFVQKFEIVIK